MLSKEDVLHIAHLARLDLSDTELKKFQSQLSNVFELFEKIQKENLENVVETSQVTGLKNVFKKDEVKCDDEQLICDTKKILSNVAQKRENLIIVPKVIEGKE